MTPAEHDLSKQIRALDAKLYRQMQDLARERHHLLNLRSHEPPRNKPGELEHDPQPSTRRD